MKIPLFRPKVDLDVLKELEGVFQSAWIGMGPKVDEFEEAICKAENCNYAVSVNSGTAALHLALLLYNIGEDDIVITTPFTYISTNMVIKYQRAIPMFVDIEENGCISPQGIVSAIEYTQSKNLPYPKAILAVHYG